MGTTPTGRKVEREGRECSFYFVSKQNKNYMRFTTQESSWLYSEARWTSFAKSYSEKHRWPTIMYFEYVPLWSIRTIVRGGVFGHIGRDPSVSCKSNRLHVIIRARGERRAVSYRRTGWVEKMTGWSSSRLQENEFPIISEESIE